MSWDMAAVRKGLANNLRSLKPSVNVSPYMVYNPVPPCIEIFPASVDYDLASQRGLDRITMTVRAYVSYGADIGPQELLDEFMAESGDRSMKELIEAEPTLDNVIQDLRVTGMTGTRPYVQQNGTPLLGSEWSVEMLV